MNEKPMELLAPAGNLEKLHYAYRYGADAAYIGVKQFSLRQKADNFHTKEYEEIRRIKQDKKLYGALNIFFHNGDIAELNEQLDYLARYPFDAFIISDIGAAAVVKERFPDIPLHLSTQANCVNWRAAQVYRDLGFKRIILGRETTLDEVKEIKDRLPDLELEVFVHGAMCLAYSGRCFLSKYMADRSANHGDCSHSCRWKFKGYLEEKERPGEFFPIEEYGDYTTILSSKDLCLIDHLDKLKEAGVDSCKIEGRMKSSYYVSIVTRAYRKALEALYNPAGGPSREELDAYKSELYKVSHREFSTGFLFGKRGGESDIESPNLISYLRQYLFLGAVAEPAGDNRWYLDVKNQIKEGEPIEFIGPDILFKEDADFRLLDEKGNPVQKAEHGKVFMIETNTPLEPGFLIRRKIRDSEVAG